MGSSYDGIQECKKESEKFGFSDKKREANEVFDMKVNEVAKWN